ncbi:hypothetical protein CR513_53213, partial [Mucuna pruriens]
MVSHIAKARAAAEELKGSFVCNSVEETTKRIDKILMVLILRSLHLDYEHVRDQILSSEQIPSMNSLVTRLLRVPTITKGDGIVVENSTMIVSHGRGRSGRGTRGILRNGKDGHGRLIYSHYGEEGHQQNICYDLIGWPDKITNISLSDTPSNGRTGSQLISDEEYQVFLRLKSNNHTQSSASPSVSTACISQSMGSQGPWIIDSGASDHISGNESVFSSISSPKFPHFISLANGSKMDQNMGQLIGKGHESRGLYYLSNNPSTLCFLCISKAFA